MDTAFAKIVTDAHGRDFILIGGQVIGLDAPLERNNELVGIIVSGLRAGRSNGGVMNASTAWAADARTLGSVGYAANTSSQHPVGDE